MTQVTDFTKITVVPFYDEHIGKDGKDNFHSILSVNHFVLLQIISKMPQFHYISGILAEHFF